MSWKIKYRSIYYEGAPEPDDLVLPAKEKLLFSSSTFRTPTWNGPTAPNSPKAEQLRFDAWTLIS